MNINQLNLTIGKDIYCNQYKWLTTALVSSLYLLENSHYICLCPDLNNPEIALYNYKNKEEIVISKSIFNELFIRGFIQSKGHIDTTMEFFGISNQGRSLMVQIKAQVNLSDFGI